MLRTPRWLTLALLGIALRVVPTDASTDIHRLFPIDWTGTEAIRAGDYKRALSEILSGKKGADTLFRHFRLALAHSKSGNFSKAIFLLRLTAANSSDLAPFAYDLIGDIEQELSRPQNALHAYRTVLSHKLPSRYRKLIFEKIRLILEADSSDVARAPWLDEYYAWLTTQKKAPLPPSPWAMQIDSLIAASNWDSLDMVLDTVRSALGGTDGCTLLERLSESGAPDSAFTTAHLFLLAQLSQSCRKTQAAERWLSASEKRKDFESQVGEKSYLHFRASLFHDQGKLEQAIKFYKKYSEKFGAEADVVLTIARAYRKLDKDTESAHWYEKHVQLFPSHPKTQEIVWLRAWQEEERGKHSRAGGYYRRVYSTYCNGSRTEEAYIRHSLSFYRQEKYDSALAILDSYQKKFPVGDLNLAGSYWKAKSLLALDRFPEATELLTSISHREPSDYYAHRSRQIMVLLGDTTVGFSIDTLFDPIRARTWLDSISPRSRKILKQEDSLNYRRGLMLASVGWIDKADCFLEPLELSFPGNLGLQLEMSALYRLVGAPAHAYRIARRFAWRIPQECRGSLPLAVYTLLYPPFFADIIKGESDNFNVDPHLVSALIRQESIFNPSIVSPVGAVGLMQIMPYTGEHIAKKLGVQFLVDSLYSPHPNIRFGTYYIRELLDQFSDNLVLVLAGYNGGPHNATKWYERNKEEEFDLFVEDIAFSETRGYVKKVLANYWTYRALTQIASYVYR